jgi:nitroreductase
MKTKFFLFAIVVISVSKLNAQTADNGLINMILSGYSERSFTAEAVSDQQLDLILKCGIKAPSARNLQPWRFTVIRDEPSMKELISNVVPGNVLIVVSGVLSESGATPDFDCGLATESMFVAAHSLGLGARIYGSTTGKVNAAGEQYQIPAGYKAVIILRIGNVDKSVDAVTAASPRKNFEELVNFKK